MVKTLPAGMQTDLDAGATTHCLCWKVTRTDAVVMGFTDHDKDLTFDSVTFIAASGLSASAIKNSTNMSVDDMETIGALISTAITEDDILKKRYDNAAVTVYRVDWSNVTKRVIIFSGFLGAVTRGRLYFKAEVRSLSEVLNQPTGEVYQKTCRVDLFDSRCAVAIGSNPDYQRTGTVAGVFSNRLFWTTTGVIIALASDWFTAGKITFTSGNNNGQSAEVKSHIKQTGGTEAWLDLWELMPKPIVIGDSFTITAGCDKTIETCKAKFNNVVNFRGFPRMPGQDVVLALASKKDKNDGSSWYS